MTAMDGVNGVCAAVSLADGAVAIAEMMTLGEASGSAAGAGRASAVGAIETVVLARSLPDCGVRRGAGCDATGIVGASGSVPPSAGVVEGDACIGVGGVGAVATGSEGDPDAPAATIPRDASDAGGRATPFPVGAVDGGVVSPGGSIVEGWSNA